MSAPDAQPVLVVVRAGNGLAPEIAVTIEGRCHVQPLTLDRILDLMASLGLAARLALPSCVPTLPLLATRPGAAPQGSAPGPFLEGDGI